MINQGASDFGEPKSDSAMNRRIAEREKAARENPDVQRGLEQAKKGELTDGPKLDRRAAEEDRRQDFRREGDAPTPTDINELRALAATVRQCQRNGHPDASKHLETLLTKLGA